MNKDNESNYSLIGVIISFGIILIIVAVVFWYQSPNTIPDIKVEIDGPNEIFMNESFNYTIKISNDGELDLIDVKINDSIGFNWTGNLSKGESKDFSIQYKGSILEGEVIEVFSEGFTKEGKRVLDKSSWVLTNVHSGNYNLLEALEKNLIAVEFRGTGYSSGESIDLKITSNVEFSIDIKIEAGLILKNSGLGQNMIIGFFLDLFLEPKIELEIEIEAYCLDSQKDNPSSEETFSIQTDSGDYDEDVQKLMRSLENVTYSNKSVNSVQIALWVITENITEEEITIDYIDEEINDAKWLLENIGIDTSNKKLFEEK